MNYSNKMGTREKALKSMMDEEPMMAMKKPDLESAPEGMESMLVSAEEKAMILQMRGQKPGGESQELENGEEAEMMS